MGMRERGEDGECGCVNAGTVEREENQWQHVGCVGECGRGECGEGLEARRSSRRRDWVDSCGMRGGERMYKGEGKREYAEQTCCSGGMRGGSGMLGGMRGREGGRDAEVECGKEWEQSGDECGAGGRECAGISGGRAGECGVREKCMGVNAGSRDAGERRMECGAGKGEE